MCLLFAMTVAQLSCTPFVSKLRVIAVAEEDTWLTSAAISSQWLAAERTSLGAMPGQGQEVCPGPVQEAGATGLCAGQRTITELIGSGCQAAEQRCCRGVEKAPSPALLTADMMIQMYLKAHANSAQGAVAAEHPLSRAFCVLLLWWRTAGSSLPLQSSCSQRSS